MSYEQILKVPTYFTYDPYTQQLQVRQLQERSYHLSEATTEGQFYIPALRLYLGLW